jgi:hypothetical protein
MNPDILAEIAIAGCTILINVGITKQKVDRMREEVDQLESQISANNQDLQKRIFECREETLRHAQSYVSREEFFSSMSELSRDIKKLMRMVGRKDDSE